MPHYETGYPYRTAGTAPLGCSSSNGGEAALASPINGCCMNEAGNCVAAFNLMSVPGPIPCVSYQNQCGALACLNNP